MATNWPHKIWTRVVHDSCCGTIGEGFQLSRLLAFLLCLALPALPCSAQTAAVIVNNCSTAVSLGQTNEGGTIYGDSTGLIVPPPSLGSDWNTAYETYINAAWSFLLNDIPYDPNDGISAVFAEPYLYPGNPPTMADYLEDNPAGRFSILSNSALYEYSLSKNPQYLSFAESLLNYSLVNDLSPSNQTYWPNMPCSGALIGKSPTICYELPLGALPGVFLEPDKSGEVGLSYLKTYEVDGSAAFENEAILIGNTLAANVRTGNATQSPWPFRVNADTNLAPDAGDDYTASVIPQIMLFDELIRLNIGNVAAYTSARATALTWFFTYPLATNEWSNYFEDVPGNLANLNAHTALFAAYYLLNNPSVDPQWQSDVAGIISWVETNLAATAFGANTIEEQLLYPFAMSSHTSHYAQVVALYGRLANDPASLLKAQRSLNWVTYSLLALPPAPLGGQIILNPFSNDPGMYELWFTDGYATPLYFREVMEALQ